MLISQVVEIINGNKTNAHGNKSIAAVSQQHVETNQLSSIAAVRKVTMEDMIKIERDVGRLELDQDQQHGNKPTLIVTKHKQKETLVYYENKSTTAARKVMTETRNRKKRWLIMETNQLRIRQFNLSKLSNL
jgi:hypothetical protein